MLIINKIRSFTKLQLSVKLKISFRKMETESLRTSNAVVDYNVRKESVYMEESENIMKYIFNGINENINFSEIATDSVPTLGYIIDPRSFAYSIEYLREQVSKQGLEQAEMFNNLIQQTDDLGLYNITSDNVVLKNNYKDIYNDYVTNISYNTLETKDISEKDTASSSDSDDSSAASLDMVSDTKQQDVDIEILNYITRSINTETPISCIIKESVNLGYNMSSTNFFNAMEALIKDDTELMLNYLRKYDDIELYFIASDNEICKYSSSHKQYDQLLEETATDSDTGTVASASDSNSDVVKASDTENESASESESERYSLPADSDSTSNSSNSGISFEHDLNLEDNKTILILTVITFVAIKFIAWYVHTYHKDTTAISQSDVNNTDDSLHSVYEHSFNSLSYKLFLCLVPSFFVILYSLRNYYFYKYFYKFK